MLVILPSEAEWDDRKSIGIVLAAEGYPETVRKGDVISGIGQSPEDTKIFHAGTATTEDGHVITAGGRVLCVTALRRHRSRSSNQCTRSMWSSDIYRYAVS